MGRAARTRRGLPLKGFLLSLQTRTRAVSRFFTTGVKFKFGGAPTGEQNKRMEGCRANKVQPKPNSAYPHPNPIHRNLS